MTRWWLAALALTACDSGRGYLQIHAHADSPLDGIARFDVVLTAGSQRASGSLSEAPPLSLPVDFAVEPTPARSGAVHLEVTALDVRGATLAHGAADGTFTAGEVARLDLPMVVDAPPPPDLAHADLTGVDDAAARDLSMSDLAVCGVAGEPCCGGTTCSDGSACLHGATSTVCAAFAGGYQSAAGTTCGGGAFCNGNPLTGGNCTCPTNFTATQMPLIDVGCSGGTMNSDATVALCQVAGALSASDWGGAYFAADNFLSCLASAATSKNPATNDFTCPLGAEEVKLRIFVPTSNYGGPASPCPNAYIGGTLGVCLRTPAITIAGVYEAFDAGGACAAASASSSGCVCPPSTTPLSMHTISNDPSNMSPRAATIVFCMIALP